MILAGLCIAAGLQAQNLDPTVEVSRAYEGKLIEVRKPAIEMSVPDTLYKFDLGFDYSVFENPYRGSYEFNPYMMDMRPESNLQKPSQFYMPKIISKKIPFVKCNLYSYFSLKA